MSDTSIVYYTDGSLNQFLFKKCQEYLFSAAEGKRIITVSQAPMDFGDNINMGALGRSHHSLFLQALTGAKAATTKYIALAEHDCVYHPEHFNWIPPDDKLFWYNVNHWLVEWGGFNSGMYSYHRRKVMSQLICERNIFIEAIEEKLLMLEHSAGIRRGQPGACEPGVCDNRKAFVDAKKEMLASQKDVGKDRHDYRAAPFRTINPNLDIRHKTNFSGGRRAKDRRYSLPPWGGFHSVMGVVPPGAWYQEATINNDVMPAQRQRDTNAKRWEGFISPFVELTSGTVTDLGCNAGFYCRKFIERGFKAIGVEKAPDALRHAYYWEGRDPRGVKIVESDINNYQITASQYVLLANVHYWLTPAQLQKLIKQLREQALHVVIVSRRQGDPNHLSPCDVEFLRKLFVGWTRHRVIKGGKHFSTMFTNPDLR